MRFVLALFIIVPITEMFVLLQVGELIGAAPTILLVMLTAVLGVFLLRRQGVATLTRAQERMQQGQMPAAEMIEGIALAVGGALLLTPGFITDTFGFACLIPWTRRKMAAFAIAHFSSMSGMRSTVHERTQEFRDQSRSSKHQHTSSQDAPEIIEGEYKVDD